MKDGEGSDELNGLDDKINVRGYFERILKEREKLEDERIGRTVDRFDAIDKALELQAEEYARRLKDLNGEYQRDKQRQTNYVTVERWEATNDGERLAREAALLRVDEKFTEYVRQYELRQREIDLLLAAQKGSADQALRAAEEQGRKSNKNLTIASLALAVFVFAAPVIPTFFAQ